MIFCPVSTVILPYYRDGKMEGTKGNSKKDIVFRRHVVDRMPIDCWNDVWHKLHQQMVNVDVFNVDTVPAEVYSTVATAVIWSMRLGLSVALYLWIDSMMRPIYAKLIPCDLGSPSKTTRQPLKRRALGSLGKSRYVGSDFLVTWFWVLNFVSFHAMDSWLILVILPFVAICLKVGKSDFSYIIIIASPSRVALVIVFVYANCIFIIFLVLISSNFSYYRIMTKGSSLISHCLGVLRHRSFCN